jgi:hypothetical protein
MKELKPRITKTRFKVSLRRQAAAEQEQFIAAIDLMLAEWVRQEIGSGDENNVQCENPRRSLCRAEAL